MKARARSLALAFPLLVLAGLTLQAHWQRAHSEVWYFPVAGYDPRDLLRGHYLRFQIDVNRDGRDADCPRADPDCCYCLTPGKPVEGVGFEASIEGVSCAAAPEVCTAFVRARPLHALQRFYIPEARREFLGEVLREAASADNAHLEVAVDGNGTPAVRRLLVFGEAIERQREPVAHTAP